MKLRALRTAFAVTFVSAGAQSGAVIALQARIVNTQGASIVAVRRAVHVAAANIWELSLDEDRDPVAADEIYAYRLTVRHRVDDPHRAVLGPREHAVAQLDVVR